ncbi:hypothetical protein MIND_00838900 [Mycena indigotica]|uniref:Uncharacterized protein n=1 Tax=Mycena indigotica TaxID=2126181 RepID=A0A8H6SGD9_9AGAR|nr:uncharacterized protein MIND_00838900 [Mycena indigotica]KAF7298909.1 hypothetical protein MIND_00838900 [Mycena indigotica]
MYLSTDTKNSLSEILSLVQRTVRSAETEIEEAAQNEIARMRDELDQVKRERDDALKTAHNAEIAASRREAEFSKLKLSTAESSLKMEASIDTLRREVTHWQGQAKNWQEHYNRVEQERCGLATELVTLSRSALTESPPKRETQTVPPLAGPPSPSDSGSPQASRTKPQTPILSAKAKGKQAETVSSHKTSASRPSKPATGQAPRQILIRRVQAVVHVKEEDDEEDIDMSYQQVEEEEEDELEHDSVRIVKRRRSGLMVADEEDYQSGHDEDDESGEDELIMNASTMRNLDVYGGVPLTQTSSRQKRLNGNAPQSTEASPTKRRRVMPDTGRSKAPVKRK